MDSAHDWNSQDEKVKQFLAFSSLIYFELHRATPTPETGCRKIIGSQSKVFTANLHYLLHAIELLVSDLDVMVVGEDTNVF